MFNPIVPLTLDDLPDCPALAQDREWLPEDHKWRLLFAVGTVYGLRDQAGDLVGTTVLSRYGTGLAAVSMVLVAARYGGQGPGRRLMTHALAGAGDAIVFLNATEHGRPLYEKLGFVSAGTTCTHVGGFVSPGSRAGSRPAKQVDLPVIRKLDAQANGADRVHLDDRYPQLHDWATQHGVAPRNSTTVMVHGGQSLPGDRSRWFIPLMQALG